MKGLKKVLIDILVAFLAVLSPAIANGQEQQPLPELNIIFYNAENLFDTRDDPQTLDDEFLPDGARNWNRYRFENKINKIAKVIIASCGFQIPAVVGLCEVENRYVLEKLCGETPLKNYNYRIIHKDSPDDRGIDVALLYRPEIVKPFIFEYIPLHDEKGKIMRTREILYAGFVVPPDDTLHVFFNHWPSRYSGQAETEPLRMIAARTLKQKTDSLIENGTPRIVIMGDFNDQPRNRSLIVGLEAQKNDDRELTGELINLSTRWPPMGTLKYRQSWHVFDQVIVSDFLLNNGSMRTTFEDAEIVNLDFLLEPDPKFKGNRLYRTYLGYRYQGGFSDHLPIRLKLTINP